MRRWRMGLAVCGLLIAGLLHAQRVTAQIPAEATHRNDTVSPAHPATEAQIREYMALTGMAKTSHEMMTTMVKAMKETSAPYFIPAFWDDVSEQMLKLDVVKIFVPIYQRYLSEEDMNGVIAFYRSGAGKRLLEVQAVMVTEARAELGKRGREIGDAAYARHKAEIDAAKAKYDSKQLALPN